MIIVGLEAYANCEGNDNNANVAEEEREYDTFIFFLTNRLEVLM